MAPPPVIKNLLLCRVFSAPSAFSYRFVFYILSSIVFITLIYRCVSPGPSKERKRLDSHPGVARTWFITGLNHCPKTIHSVMPKTAHLERLALPPGQRLVPKRSQRCKER